MMKKAIILFVLFSQTFLLADISLEDTIIKAIDTANPQDLIRMLAEKNPTGEEIKEYISYTENRHRILSTQRKRWQLLGLIPYFSTLPLILYPRKEHLHYGGAAMSGLLLAIALNLKEKIENTELIIEYLYAALGLEHQNSQLKPEASAV